MSKARDELRENIHDMMAKCAISYKKYGGGGRYFYVEADQILSQVDTYVKEIKKQTASDIFNLAHQYAQEDKTMVGSEELRAYHYFNAIHKIGEFDGR